MSSNTNYEMLLNVINANGEMLQYISKEFITPELCLKAIRNNNTNINYIPDELFNRILMLDGMFLEYIPKDKRTYDLCLVAIKQNHLAVKFIEQDMIDKDICYEIITQPIKHMIDNYIPNKFKHYCEDLILQHEVNLYENYDRGF